MNSSKLPSGSRMYTLEAPFLRPPWRATGPSMTLAPARSSKAFSDSGVPSQTKHKSPQGGLAAEARSVKLSCCQVEGR